MNLLSYMTSLNPFVSEQSEPVRPKPLLETSINTAQRRLESLMQRQLLLESDINKLVEDLRQTKLCIEAEQAKLTILGVVESSNADV